MSSVSSFVCLSSDVDSNDGILSEWSMGANTHQSEADSHSISAVHVINDTISQDVCFSENGGFTTSSFSESYDHIDGPKRVRLPESDWSSTCDEDAVAVTEVVHDDHEVIDPQSDHLFDVRSIGTVSSHHSVDSVRANYIFGDYRFAKKKNPSSTSSKWVWLHRVQNKRKIKPRRKRKNRLQSTPLCIIEEEGEIEEELQIEDEEERENKKAEEEEGGIKTVVNVSDLNQWIEDHIDINDHIPEVIRLCNDIAKTGILKVNGMEIELHDMPLIGQKLRDQFFRKLVLLNHHHEEGDECSLRRGYWVKLSWNSRRYLCPMGSFDEFRDLYSVHKSVCFSEFMTVYDAESFDLLSKAEWIRVVLYKSYIARKSRRAVETRDYDEMNRIRSLYHRSMYHSQVMHTGDFNVVQQKVYSYITEEVESRNEWDSEWEEMDAMEENVERELEEMHLRMDMKSRMGSEVTDALSCTSIAS